MAASIQTLIAPVRLGAAAAVLFTATATTRVDAASVVNTSAADAASLTVYWVREGQAPGDANAVVAARPMQPLEVWTVSSLIGQVLASGDTLQAFATGAGTLNLAASGTAAS